MEWIKVGDRLPDTNQGDSDDVLIAVSYGNSDSNSPDIICCGYLLDSEWWAYSEHNCNRIGSKIWKGDKVTHWMPLPALPKEEGDLYENRD